MNKERDLINRAILFFSIIGAELERRLLIRFRHIQSYLNKILIAFLNERKEGKLIQLDILGFHQLFINWAGKTETNLLSRKSFTILR